MLVVVIVVSCGCGLCAITPVYPRQVLVVSCERLLSILAISSVCTESMVKVVAWGPSGDIPFTCGCDSGRGGKYIPSVVVITCDCEL